MGNDMAGVKKPAEDVVVIANRLERRIGIILDRCERLIQILKNVAVMWACVAVCVILHVTSPYDIPYIELFKYLIILALISAFVVFINILFLFLF